MAGVAQQHCQQQQQQQETLQGGNRGFLHKLHKSWAALWAGSTVKQHSSKLSVNARQASSHATDLHMLSSSGQTSKRYALHAGSSSDDDSAGTILAVRPSDNNQAASSEEARRLPHRTWSDLLLQAGMAAVDPTDAQQLPSLAGAGDNTNNSTNMYSPTSCAVGAGGAAGKSGSQLVLHHTDMVAVDLPVPATSSRHNELATSLCTRFAGHGSAEQHQPTPPSCGGSISTGAHTTEAALPVPQAVVPQGSIVLPQQLQQIRQLAAAFGNNSMLGSLSTITEYSESLSSRLASRRESGMASSSSHTQSNRGSLDIRSPKGPAGGGSAISSSSTNPASPLSWRLAAVTDVGLCPVLEVGSSNCADDTAGASPAGVDDDAAAAAAEKSRQMYLQCEQLLMVVRVQQLKALLSCPLAQPYAAGAVVGGGCGVGAACGAAAE